MNYITNRIKILRDIKCLSGTQLAGKVGVTVPYIYMIENGQKTPSLRVANKIAKVLGETIEYVFGLDNEVA